MKNAGLLSILLAALAGSGAETPHDRDEIPELTGFLRPKRYVSIGATTDGLLSTVLADTGDIVEGGQVIAELDSRVARASAAVAKHRADQDADLKIAEENLRKKRFDAERLTVLALEGATNKQDLDDVLSEVTDAEIKVEKEIEKRRLNALQYQEELARIDERIIRTPVSGVVVERLRSPGEVVTRSYDSSIMKIAQIDVLVVDVIVPLELLGSVREGMTANVHPEGPVRDAIQAKVAKVSRVADAASATFTIEIEIPNEDYALTAGLKCIIKLQR